MNRILRFPALAFLFTVLLTPLFPQPAPAADYGLLGFDVRAGVAIPDDHDNGFAVGVSAPVVRWGLKGLSLHPALQYAAADIDLISDGSANVETSTLGFGVEVRYFPSRDWSGLYFGGGPYFFSTDRGVVLPPGPGSSDPQVFDTQNDSFGTVAFVGYQFGDWGGSFLGEGRIVSTNSFDQFQVMAGYSW